MGEIKVTDKRMFTPDGRLREEFEQFESPEQETAPAAESAIASEPAPPASEPEPEPGQEAEQGPAPPGWESAGRGPTLELPGTPPGLGPNFADLVAALAEPATLYLGDVSLPDGASAENLEAARYYIDLIDLLRQRTAGKLSAQEHAFLEDVLYRLRVRYVQKRG